MTPADMLRDALAEASAGLHFDAPATAWFWALDNDMQGAVVLGILSLAGLIVWAVRGWRDARRVIGEAPTFEQSAYTQRNRRQECSPFVKVGPGVYAIRPDSDLAAQLRESIVGLECELTADEVEAWIQSREGTA